MSFLNRWLAVSFFGLSLLATSATAASVSGRVRDTSTNSYLVGASVVLSELNRTATSGAGGSFSFGEVPAGTYTLVVKYLGYPNDTREITVGDEARIIDVSIESDLVKLDNFVVAGTRAGQAMALQQKRTSNNIMDAVSADAVGKFPDGNAAEALRRVPGVSLEIDQGEGRFVVIRGIDASLNTVTLNGQLLGSPAQGGGRGIAMDSVPTDLISRLEIVKAVTPDMDGTSIGGSVNIVTQSAFDRAEGFLQGSVAGGYNDFSGESPFAGSLSFGRILGEDQRWGVVAGVSYSKRNFASQTSDAGGWALENGFWVPDEVSSFDYMIERERLGLNGALEFRPRAGHELAFRYNHNVFTDNEGRQNSDFNFLRGSLSNQTATTGSNSGGRATREFRDYEQIHTIDALSVSGKHELPNGFELEWQGGTSRGERDTPKRVDWEFRSGGNDFPNTYSTSRDDLVIVTPSANFYDPASYPFRRVRFRTDLEQEDVASFQADLKKDLDLGGKNAYVKAGFKYVKRDKSQDRENTNYGDANPNFTLGDFGLAGTEPSNYFRGAYRYGPTINLPVMQQYFAANQSLFDPDPLGSLENSTAGDFTATEKVFATYLMGSIDLSPEWTLLAGVRLESTKADNHGNELVLDDGDFTGTVNKVSGGSDYDNFMPGIHLNWHPNDKVVVRAAWTNTIGRPDYSALSPSREFDSEDIGGGLYEGSVSSGNPDLKPYESMNIDLTLEYYLENGGVASIAGFSKKIDNPIYGFSEVQTNVTVNGRTFSRLSRSRPENADNGEITGLELNYQQFFTKLPSPFDGLGVNFNYTVTNSSVKIFGRTDEIPFFKQSDEIGNIALMYEKYGFQARVAMSFNSAYLDSVGSSDATDGYTDGRSPIDVKLSYRINSKITIFADVQNLNEEPLKRYQGISSRSLGNEIYSWNANFGINFSL